MIPDILDHHPATDPVGGDPTTCPGVAVAVQEPGDETRYAASGMANLEAVVPLAPTTLFNVGSVAKQVTAHVAVLADRGRILPLRSKVSSLLPDLKLGDVTVLDLVRHQSGLRDVESLLSLAGLRDRDPYTSTDLLRLAYRQARPAIGPGEFLYSNTNYLILAEALEHAAGIAFSALAAELVFDRLGMTTAAFKVDALDVIPHAAASYRPLPLARWVKAERLVSLPGPGSLWCSAVDLDRWLRHLHQVWVESRLGLPFGDEVPYVASDKDRYLYGPGLYACPGRQVPTVFHYGHEHGFSAAAHLARDGTRIACLSNDASTRADHVAAHLARVACSDRATLDRPRWLDDAVTLCRQQPEAEGQRPQPHADTRPPRQDQESFGTFRCPEVPGTIQLSFGRQDLYLWRRGTATRLARTDITTYTGAGISVVLQHPLASDRPIDAITVNLDRAPGLYYQRQDLPSA